MSAERTLRDAWDALNEAVTAARGAGYIVTWPKREGEPLIISESSRVVHDEGVDVIGGFSRPRRKR